MKLPRELINSLSTCTEEECVYVLFGVDGQVARYVKLTNVLHSRTAFLVDPEEMYRALKDNEDLDLLGLLHTHPCGSSPSPIDARYMDLWPVVWVIYSVCDGRIEAWFRDVDICKIPVEIMG